jgi:hypothetical protein
MASRLNLNCSRLLLCGLCSIGLGLATSTFGQNPGDETARYAKIRDGLKKLLPLVGKWDVAVTFHDPDGTVTEEVGNMECLIRSR